MKLQTISKLYVMKLQNMLYRDEFIKLLAAFSFFYTYLIYLFWYTLNSLKNRFFSKNKFYSIRYNILDSSLYQLQ